MIHVNEFFQPRLEKHISHNREAQFDKDLHVLAVGVLRKNRLKVFSSEILMLYFHELANVVLELIVLKLFQIFWTQDHVLDQLSNLLIKLNSVWPLVNELRDVLPVVELAVCSCLSTSEAADHFAEHLAGLECLRLRLLNPEHAVVALEVNGIEGFNHLAFDDFFSQGD